MTDQVPNGGEDSAEQNGAVVPQGTPEAVVPVFLVMRSKTSGLGLLREDGAVLSTNDDEPVNGDIVEVDGIVVRLTGEEALPTTPDTFSTAIAREGMECFIDWVKSVVSHTYNPEVYKKEILPLFQKEGMPVTLVAFSQTLVNHVVNILGLEAVRSYIIHGNFEDITREEVQRVAIGCVDEFMKQRGQLLSDLLRDSRKR